MALPASILVSRKGMVPSPADMLSRRCVCHEVCRFADKLYGWLHLESAHYDGSLCFCERCPNFDICKAWVPRSVFMESDCALCPMCRKTFGSVIQCSVETLICPVCYAFEKLAHIPACGHSLCTRCIYKIAFPKDEDCYHLDPRPYGAPPCPNACRNPRRGVQCYCIEYDVLLDAWGVSEPEAFRAFREAEEMSILCGEEIGSALGSALCPFCRSDFKANS